MARNRLLPAVALGLALAACNPTYVDYDYDRNVDFSRFKTFEWMEQKATPEGKPKTYAQSGLLKARIERAVDDGLEAKGLRRVDTNPDLFVSYLMGVKNYTEIRRSRARGPVPGGNTDTGFDRRGHERAGVARHRRGSHYRESVAGKTDQRGQRHRQETAEQVSASKRLTIYCASGYVVTEKDVCACPLQGTVLVSPQSFVPLAAGGRHCLAKGDGDDS
jgi:hypothetical protein